MFPSVSASLFAGCHMKVRCIEPRGLVCNKICIIMTVKRVHYQSAPTVLSKVTVFHTSNIFMILLHSTPKKKITAIIPNRALSLPLFPPSHHQAIHILNYLASCTDTIGSRKGMQSEGSWGKFQTPVLS